MLLNFVYFKQIYRYNKRKQDLDHPVAQYAMQILYSDKRVMDFCGEEVKPGWYVKKKYDEKEGTISYNFNIGGGSGKLKTTIIADYATHGSLKIFDQELKEHFSKKATDKNYDFNEFEGKNLTISSFL